MKRFKETLCLMVILSSFLFAQQPQWRLANGTFGLVIKDVDIYITNPDTIYASAKKKFLLSTDNGDNWVIKSTIGKWGGEIKVLPGRSNTLLFSHTDTPFHNGNEVMISTDGTQSWTQLFWGQGFASPIIELDPSDPPTAYISVNPNDLYRSADYGINWEQVNLPNHYFLTDFAVSPSDSNILYAAYDDAVYKSADRGSSWVHLPFYPPAATTRRVAINPHNPDIIYVSLFSYNLPPGGVYKSTDGGYTWEDKNNGLTNSDWDILDMVINPKKPEELFIGTGDVQHDLLFKTTDGGDNWFTFINGLPDSAHVSSISIDTLNDKIIVGVISSRDSSGIYVYDALTSITNITLGPSGTFLLHQNYPNPFNSTTKISYDISRAVFVRLVFYDVTGKKIKCLVEEFQPPGSYSIDLIADDLPSGLYFYSLTAGSQRLVRKALVLK